MSEIVVGCVYDGKGIAMAVLDPSVLEALGLPGSSEVYELRVVAVPTAEVAQGKVAQGPLPEALARHPWFEEIVVVGGVHASQWRESPAVMILEGDAEVLGEAQILGEVQRVAQQIILDGRRGVGYARLTTVHGEHLFKATPEKLAVLVIAPLSREIQELLAIRPSSWEIDTPDVAALLATYPSVAWLRETAQELAVRGGPLWRVAALGLIARLWTPTNARVAVETAFREGRVASPRAEVLLWARTLGAAPQLELERAALTEALALHEEVERFDDVLADPAYAELGRAWLHRRDDLECIAFIVPSARSLRAALEGVDAEAAIHLSSWALVPGLGDDARLLAVAWQEPEAWWGAIVL